MGCGCGKNKSRAQRLEEDRKQAIKLKAKKVIPQNLSSNFFAALRAKKQSICDQCPLSVQTEQERLSRTRTCHKTNRPLPDIVLDDKFKCPIGKFNPISQ